MAENRLEVGKPRLGWLHDGDVTTPDLAVLMEDTGNQLVLNVPMRGPLGTRSPYGRWFTHGFQYADDPERSIHSYRPPRTLVFEDPAGTVVLVGCRAAGFVSRGHTSNGRIVVNFAVLGGGHGNYEKLNGVRAEMPALAQWTGFKSVNVQARSNEEGRVRRLDVTLDSPSPFPLNRSMNLGLRPTWRTSPPDSAGTFSAHDIVELTTESKRGRPWQDHFGPLNAVRELLIVSAWRPLGFSRITVNRGDDPERVLSGEPIGEAWNEIATHRLPKHEAWQGHLPFLFFLNDVDAAGVRRWLRIRESFERAIRPLISIGEQGISRLDSQLVESGIALEALGYQLALDAGRVRPGRRLQLSYPEALEVILGDMKYIPLDDRNGWRERSARCYRGVKHADNQRPDELELLNTLRENLLVMRFWIAGKIGVKKSVLERRLPLDPLARAYVLLD